MSDLPPGPPLIIPVLGRLYACLSPLAETLLRLVTGGMLAVHGWPKITNPLGATAMVERIGLAPASAWSVLLSVTEFFGGLLLAIGLFTRPVAIATFIQMLVVIYFHWLVRGQGYAGSEFPIMWAACLFFFVARGANAWTVDARLGRQF
mgnify:FL=1